MPAFEKHETADSAFVSWGWINPPDAGNDADAAAHAAPPMPSRSFDLLKPIRQRLDNIKVQDAEFARFLCKRIPSQCPFERDIKLFGYTILHIPPLCKLNPLYDEVVALRFRALCYLADSCGEDVTVYC
ncbi:MAG: Mo-dependent nitrogenase C-terminal domain-containing protein [Drouetiella hepatica Uher 2000/2452]|uniref:Mo-dependent nitrogenase C-terminal domain-containing protein n=1 Tax=Drouetiella hepatica Uher 2000/2452 TaxID=904376 RepID=A0A951Q7D0_9CYAN|nr:Mo-dependent nitrogenase C-terminal domain-containing protein [Drouetiella hepatica Uher 2000/2452]